MRNRIVSVGRPTNYLWHQSLNFFMVIIMMFSRPSLSFIRHHPSLCNSIRLHGSIQVNSQYLFATTTGRILHSAKSTHCNKLHALNSKNTHQNYEDYKLTLTIPTPSDMEDIGALLSINSNKGDVILLDGDLGAGKTCFSRGFIRSKTGCGDERVTSPTYLLSNMYSIANNESDSGSNIDKDMKIYHMDLYRLSGTNEDELQPLNLPQVFSNDISLIEWPSRLHTKPEVRLDVTLTIDSTIVQEEDSDSDDDEEDGSESARRVMKLVPHGESWIERLKFLEDEGYLDDLIM